MTTFGTISYNIYCNFTNYGSALQTWALLQAIQKLGYTAKLIDYCPDILLDKNPLNPFKNMWDKDSESQHMCELSLPAIKDNYYKYIQFYSEKCNKTKLRYTSKNFNDVMNEVDAFVCGSDTIFCPDEFGFDNGYYANYECMKNSYCIAYAASFGDPHFTEETYSRLNIFLQNFKAIGLRENLMVHYVKQNTEVPVQKVLDPTLLLSSEDYDRIAEKRIIDKPYLLYYSRRYNPVMEEYVEKLASDNRWVVVEISLRAENSKKGHMMYYSAGVEEFLSLVKYAEFVVTNSFHGMIFSVQYKKEFVIFLREQCDSKIMELLDLFGLKNRKFTNGNVSLPPIDYESVSAKIAKERKKSLLFLKNELNGVNKS